MIASSVMLHSRGKLVALGDSTLAHIVGKTLLAMDCHPCYMHMLMRCVPDPALLSARLNALQGDALAMFMAMQQHNNPLMPGGHGPNFHGGNARPGHVLPPRAPHMPMGRQPGQPTPEQMMMANAEISRCAQGGL